MTELKEWLNSINFTKKNLIDEDPSIEKDYSPYIINRCFSGHIDSVMFANELNLKPNLPKKLQYDFYLNSLHYHGCVTPQSRFRSPSKIIYIRNDIGLAFTRTYYGSYLAIWYVNRD